MSDQDDIASDVASIAAACATVKSSYNGVGDQLGQYFGIGDGGSSEMGAADNIVNVTIPAIQQITAGQFDSSGNLPDAIRAKVNDLFNTAISSLKEINGWSDDSNFFTALKYTATQTASQIANAATSYALPTVGIITSVVIIAVAIAIFAKLAPSAGSA